MSKQLNEYRCTRSDPYSDPTCPGFNNVSARQGYYIRAYSKEEALEEMKKICPKDSSNSFTAHLWKTNLPNSGCDPDVQKNLDSSSGA